jgi:tricorn protease
MSASFRATALGFGALLATAGGAEAQLTSIQQTPIVGARMPALSPDGKQLAFAYRGDLWLAPTTGGRATPLTQHVETDSHPIFSPDGRWIAFASRRNGNSDIFAVPVEGGPARQLTWHSGHEFPAGWSPDCRFILFTGKRDSANQALYAVDTGNLRTEMLAEDFAPLSGPNVSPDGIKVVYGRYGFHWTRPRYHGSAAQQIWVLDRETNLRRPLTTNGAQHLWSRFLPDGKSVITVTVGGEDYCAVSRQRRAHTQPLAVGSRRQRQAPDRFHRRRRALPERRNKIRRYRL